MANWLNIDWQKMFLPTVSPLEILIRGTLIYFGIFLILRVILKRELSDISTTDILVLVLLADAAQNGMAGTYDSITDGLLLVATIVFWSFAFDWLSFHIPGLKYVLRPPPVTLVKEGHLQWRSMRKEMVTKEEIMASLREEGFTELSDIEKVILEGDGRLTVIPFEKGSNNNHSPERRM